MNASSVLSLPVRHLTNLTSYTSLILTSSLSLSLLTCCVPSSQVLSMPSSNQAWPDEFGFQLGGSGPSYILSVEEGSSAHLAGLQAGDQVLELEGHNVSTLAPQAVVAIAQTQKNIPPSIGVVSRIQQVYYLLTDPDGVCVPPFEKDGNICPALQMDIIPGPDGRFGFTIVGDCPLLVEDCSPCSPAGRAGLRAGDYVVEVDGVPVRQHEAAAAMIKASQGRTLRLGVLCLGPRQKHGVGAEDGQMGAEGARLDRKHKALEFNARVRLRDRLVTCEGHVMLNPTRFSAAPRPKRQSVFFFSYAYEVSSR